MNSTGMKTLVQCDFDNTIAESDVSFMLLDAFAGGASVSEVSEALGCSHQYVSKQRKKIALALAGVLT